MRTIPSMSRRSAAALACLALSAPALAACGHSSTSADAAGTVKAVASTTQICDYITQLASGDASSDLSFDRTGADGKTQHFGADAAKATSHLTLTCLLAPNASAHEHDMTTAQSKALSEADLFFVSNAILVFTTTLYAVYTQDWRNRWRYLLYAVGAVLGVYLIAGVVNFFVAFNLAYVAVALVVIAVGTLFYLALREYLLRYLLMAIFAIGSLGFFYSVNYVFNDILQPHQQVRIKIALGIESDLKGKGYNVDQSKIAIGSGGLTGKGFLKGTQTKLNYVPEQETDFIFCTVGEEEGFLGAAGVLVLFLLLIWRLIALAERQTSTFGRVFGYSVLSILLFHVFINIGMVLGIAPVIGIPLPFFSYGGSSLWGFTLLLFIFLRIDAGRKR